LDSFHFRTLGRYLFPGGAICFQNQALHDWLSNRASQYDIRPSCVVPNYINTPPTVTPPPTAPIFSINLTQPPTTPTAASGSSSTEAPTGSTQVFPTVEVSV
jgi:hypothetical protein